MVYFALFCTTVAVITGLLAIGRGHLWQFSVIDYFRGRQNALLYLWVIGSSAFSIMHSGMIGDYLLDHNGGYLSIADKPWFYIHACIGFLLSLAHLYIAWTAKVGRYQEYLWWSGPK